MNKENKTNNLNVLKNSALLALMFSNIVFVLIFLICFVKSSELFFSFKKSFLLSLATYISFLIIFYNFKSKPNKAENFQETNTMNQNHDEKNIIKKAKEYSNSSFQNKNEIIRSNEISKKKSSEFNTKTQFNSNFEINTEDLTNKMDM